MLFFKNQKFQNHPTHAHNPALFHTNRFLPVSPTVSKRSLAHRSGNSSLAARFILNAGGPNPRIIPPSKSIKSRRISGHPLSVFLFAFAVTLLATCLSEYGFHIVKIANRRMPFQQIPFATGYINSSSKADQGKTPIPILPQSQVDPTTSRSELEGIVASALIRHSKDTISLRDFALGTRYIADLTTATPSSLSARQLFTLRIASRLLSFDLVSRIGRLPSMALMEKIGEDYCWEFPGSYGHLGIALKERISVHQVSIDHIARELASDTGIKQAPRKMVLWGRVDGEHNKVLAKLYLQSHVTRSMRGGPAGLKDGKDLYVPLIRFEYKLLGSTHSSIQTTSVSEYLKSLNMDFEVVVLEILSNWGGQSTCLHRVRVHGSPNKSLTVHNDTI